MKGTLQWGSFWKQAAAHLALLLPVLQALLLQQGKDDVRGHHSSNVGANRDGRLCGTLALT